MPNYIVDERDQRFVLYDLLNIEQLCESEKYSTMSREVFDMILNEAAKFAVEEVFPTLARADKEGCKLENGSVKVPPSYHKLYELYCNNGWTALSVPPELGGQGLPDTMSIAAREWFMHNFAFTCYPGLSEGAANLIVAFGNQKQKDKYLAKMYTGQWGGTMCLTEPAAGSDVGDIRTRAIRQADGSFLLQGTKMFITAADSDLTENVIHPVLARIEGDPAGTAGISIFIVPKFIVNDDGSLGRRNDVSIGGIEEKMGLHGSATCLVNFGENNECYAELLGGERQGMKVMFKLMNEARVGVGLQALASASTAYLHALAYAKERLQGASLKNMRDPQAPRVPIIQHADIRRMLIWMKSHVEGMRALIYYACVCSDKAHTEKDEEEKKRLEGLLGLLTPICKAFCSDMAFRVTEMAMQIYGGYGYCSEYPVEQFMRDVKITSIYEGSNGIQALDLVGRKLSSNGGRDLQGLIAEMNGVIEKYSGNPALSDTAQCVQEAVNELLGAVMFFMQCAQQKEFMVPVINAYPFMMAMSKVVMGWLLLWEAGIAAEKLAALCAKKGVDPADSRAVYKALNGDGDMAFYAGKIASAKYFAKNVLPEVAAAASAIKSMDKSLLEIAEASFAS
jgi:alkylation response protein AidB-like acyl-CoA dehydrogenase